MFPDGSEYLDAPVRNWDLMGDLAVIGPLDSDISPLPLLDGEDLIIGSDLFLIGYPGEAEEFPQPTISKGLLSRLRQWDAIEITYLSDRRRGGRRAERRCPRVGERKSNRDYWAVIY